MSMVGGFGRSEIAFRDKIKVYDYYMGKIDEVTLGNGETIVYREDGLYSNFDRVKKDS